MAGRRTKNRNADTQQAEQQRLKPLQRQLLAESQRTVRITHEGRAQEMTLGEALVRKALQMAAGGSVHSMSNVLHAVLVAQTLQMKEQEEDVALGKRYKAYQQRMLDEALAEGKNPDTVLPHPDDILIDATGWKVVGPQDAAALAGMKQLIAVRDAFILQDTLDERSAAPDITEADWKAAQAAVGAHETIELGECRTRSSLLLAYMLDDVLPERHRLSTDEIRRRGRDYDRLTRRELLRDCYRSWAAIGAPQPRGWLSPPLPTGYRILVFVSAFRQELGERYRHEQTLTDQEAFLVIKDLARQYWRWRGEAQ